MVVYIVLLVSVGGPHIHRVSEICKCICVSMSKFCMGHVKCGVCRCGHVSQQARQGPATQPHSSKETGMIRVLNCGLHIEKEVEGKNPTGLEYLGTTCENDDKSSSDNVTTSWTWDV